MKISSSNTEAINKFIESKLSARDYAKVLNIDHSHFAKILTQWQKKYPELFNNEEDGKSNLESFRFKLFTKGEVIDYQTVIEERIGGVLANLDCYDHNIENKKIIGGKKVLDPNRAYFVPDCDYELIVRPIKKKKKDDTSKTGE